MRILLFTTLFPNSQMPNHGVFVENRLRAFLKSHDADVRVVAPTPWFPFQNKAFGRYARWAGVPKMEQRNGVTIVHPRYFILPKLAMTLAPAALSRCLMQTIENWRGEGWEPDLIDAHYFFPEGVAAADVAHQLGKPLVITARGTDINYIPQFAAPRKKIIEAALRADTIITVAHALKDELVRLGAPEQKIETLRNGVDLDLFRPADRDKLRTDMGLSGPIIASVGHLTERKGHHIVIEAMQDVPGATLLIAGEGEELAALKKQVAAMGLENRVGFLGAVAHERLCEIYNAADALVLASSREGWPNVLLEAMACGTPCIATSAWGNSEVIREPAVGMLVKERTSDDFATAIKALLKNPPARAETRRYAERFSWDETARKMGDIFSGLVERNDQGQAIKYTPLELRAQSKKPKLLITVDTEEIFDWRDFSAKEHKCAPVEDIDRLQKLCLRHNAKPLYFITYPLLKDVQSAVYFTRLFDAREADCGLHLHQWVTPCSEGNTAYTGEYYSYQKNLPPSVHLEKLKFLSDAFYDVFGERAVSHRAGRYGVCPADYALLSDIGITYEFSPSAGFDFSNSGGPNFSTVSNIPYTVLHGDNFIYVTPVPGARVVARTRLFLSQPAAAPGSEEPLPKLKEKLTIPMRLSPEGAGLADLKALTRRLIKDESPVMTLTLHSTSLTLGANDYGKTAADIDRLLKTTDDYLSWFRESLGGEIISLDDLKALYQR